MTAIPIACVQQGLRSPSGTDGLTAEVGVDWRAGDVLMRNLKWQTPTTPPRRMLSYPLNISYARPIVLSCTALHGGHQTMKWGV